MSISFLLIAGIYTLIGRVKSERTRQATIDIDRTPAKVVASINGYYIDTENRIVTAPPATPVPVIDVVTPPLAEGEQIQDSAIIKTVSLIAGMQDSELALVHAKIYNDNYIELSLADQTKLICTVACDPYTIFETLKEIKSAYTLEGRRIDTIDFRFSKPFILERYGT